jgi:hypothetical protein
VRRREADAAEDRKYLKSERRKKANKVKER